MLLPKHFVILHLLVEFAVLQALDYLHNISDEKLLEEWKQIEAFDLPYVDADEFVIAS